MGICESSSNYTDHPRRAPQFEPPIEHHRPSHSPLKTKQVTKNAEKKVNNVTFTFEEKNTHAPVVRSKHKMPTEIPHENQLHKITGVRQYTSDKYIRRNGKSASLVEKSKAVSGIFAEEMKLCVSNENFIEETKGIPKEKYNFISKLGDGAYGTVYLVRNQFTQCEFAMKRIRKAKSSTVDDAEVTNEISILKKLDHPNIVKIYEFYNTPEAYYIITEYCQGGELFSKIKLEYSEKQLAVLFFQVFSGLCYLHLNNIVHRDLKLENLLIAEIEKDTSGTKYYLIKIIDFGTAKIFEKNKIEKEVIGSSYYIAPEVLRKNYNEKCDTWSIGVILYMFIVGRAPFDGDDDDEIIKNIKIGKYDSTHIKLFQSSKEVQDLVRKLLEVNVEKRLSAREALSHPWFAKFKAREFFSNIAPNNLEKYIMNLINYTVPSKFHQIVLAFVVHNIKQNPEIKDILKLFRLFNINCDGKLTKIELYNALCEYKPKETVDKIIDDIFLSIDGDNNGFIEYEEFLRACLDKKIILSEEMLQYAFSFFDKDNSKKISLEEIKVHFMGDPASEEVFLNIVKQVDANGDGEIDFEEFKAMMKSVN